MSTDTTQQQTEQSQQPRQQPRAQPRKRRSSGDAMSRSGRRSAEFKDAIVECGIDEDVAGDLAAFLGQDFVLGNIDSTDREYLRLLTDNIVEYVRALHPPQDSQLQGSYRAAMLEDPRERGRRALTDQQLIEFRKVLLTYFIRLSRSQGGWQQDKFGEQQTTKRIEDARGQDDSSLFGGLFS